MMGAHGGATICFRSLEVEGKGRNGNTTPGDSRTSHKISALKIPLFPTLLPWTSLLCVSLGKTSRLITVLYTMAVLWVHKIMFFVEIHIW